MHLKRVIPCLDVDAGRVVKGVEFVDIRDAGDPVELAAHYDREGADELVFLDITATHEGRETIVQLARRTADEVFVPFTIGGGIRSVRDAQAVLDAGADKVAINSAALRRPQLIDELARVFGTQCVVLAIDAKARGAVPGAGGAADSAAGEDGAAGGAAADGGAADGGAARGGAARGGTARGGTARGGTARGGTANGWEAYLAGGRTPTGRDVVGWAREAVERGARGDPVDEHGPRRHERRL